MFSGPILFGGGSRGPRPRDVARIKERGEGDHKLQKAFKESDTFHAVTEQYLWFFNKNKVFKSERIAAKQ